MLYLAIPNIINLAIRNLKGRVYMEYVEQNPLPEVCLRCEDRAGCLARGRGAVLRGMRASARAVFAAGTSEIEKKKAGNVLTNITCLCFRYTIDEHGVSSLRKGRKCERNPSGVSFAFNSRPQASQSARQTAHQKRKTRICVSSFFGAGDRTRTGTPSLAVDFESTTSTNSITPASLRFSIQHPAGKFKCRSGGIFRGAGAA